MVLPTGCPVVGVFSRDLLDENQSPSHFPGLGARGYKITSERVRFCDVVCNNNENLVTIHL